MRDTWRERAGLVARYPQVPVVFLIAGIALLALGYVL